MAKVNVQIFVDNVSSLTPAAAAIRTKIQNYLDSEPDAQLTRFSYVEEALTAKVNIMIFVDNVTLAGLNAIRLKIQSFLDAEPDAQLTLFSYTED